MTSNDLNNLPMQQICLYVYTFILFWAISLHIKNSTLIIKKKAINERHGTLAWKTLFRIYCFHYPLLISISSEYPPLCQSYLSCMCVSISQIYEMFILKRNQSTVEFIISCLCERFFVQKKKIESKYHNEISIVQSTNNNNYYSPKRRHKINNFYCCCCSFHIFYLLHSVKCKKMARANASQQRYEIEKWLLFRLILFGHIILAHALANNK